MKELEYALYKNQPTTVPALEDFMSAVGNRCLIKTSLSLAISCTRPKEHTGPHARHYAEKTYYVVWYADSGEL